jgi:hypothetical protein
MNEPGAREPNFASRFACRTAKVETDYHNLKILHMASGFCRLANVIRVAAVNAALMM